MMAHIEIVFMMEKRTAYLVTTSLVEIVVWLGFNILVSSMWPLAISPLFDGVIGKTNHSHNKNREKHSSKEAQSAECSLRFCLCYGRFRCSGGDSPYISLLLF